MKRTPVIVPTVDPDDYRRAQTLYSDFLRADLIALLAQADAEIARLTEAERHQRRLAARAAGEKQFAKTLCAEWQQKCRDARAELKRLERSTDTPRRVNSTCLNCSGRF